MSLKITASIRRALRVDHTPHHDVHFHLGPDGRAFVCDHVRCESASVSARELGLS